MKKQYIYLVALFFCLPLVSIAQKNFEGIIIYEMKFEGNQAKELAMMMPTSYTYIIKGSNSKMTMEGGMAAAMMEGIYVDGENNKVFMVQPDTEVAYEMPQEEEMPEDIERKVEKLDGKEKVLDYTCEKYKVILQTPQGTMTQYTWVTQDLNIKLPKMSSNMMGGGLQLIPGVKGFPLKVVMEMPMGMGEMIMEVSDINKRKIDKKEVSLPKGYKIEAFDPSSFMRF